MEIQYGGVGYPGFDLQAVWPRLGSMTLPVLRLLRRRPAPRRNSFLLKSKTNI